MFILFEETLDAVALAIERAAEACLPASMDHGRNVGGRPGRFDVRRRNQSAS
jgi:hypothetical protein